MNKVEFVQEKTNKENVLEIIKDEVLNNITENSKEYILSFFEKDENDKVFINTIQYYVIDNKVYERK